MSMFWYARYLVVSLAVLAAASLLVGCATRPPQNRVVQDFQQGQAQHARVDKLNQQLAVQSAMPADSTTPRDDESYKVGPGDLLELTVLGVPELSRDVRVDGGGAVVLPLIGVVPVGGKTVAQASQLVAERYGKSYLRDPQVSVLVKEYRSQRITVLGSVNKPEVYSVQRRVGVLEALAMAGGLTPQAGRMVYVNERVKNPDGEGMIRRNLIISLDDLVGAQDKITDPILSDGAVVNVPEAGVVYVEGAVAKPGVYPLQRDTSVLKAITMAGGIEFAAAKSGIRVLRTGGVGSQAQEFGAFNIDTLRASPGSGPELQDGDVVVVGSSAFKSTLQGVGNAAKGFFGFGYSLN